MSIDLTSSASSTATLRQTQQPAQNDLMFALNVEKKSKCDNSMEDFLIDDKPTNNAYYNTACYQDSSINSSLNSKNSNSMNSNKSSVKSSMTINNSNKDNCIRPCNQNNLDHTRSTPVLKQTSSTSSSSSQSTTNFKLAFYKFLLSAIKFAILFAQMFQIYFFQFTYFIRIQYEQKIQRRYFDNSINDNNKNKLVSPTHVCVVLNEDVRDSEIIYDKLALVAEFFALRGVKYLSFYRFEGNFCFALIFTNIVSLQNLIAQK